MGVRQPGSIYAEADATEASPELLQTLQDISVRIADCVRACRPGQDPAFVPTLALGNRYADHTESVGAHSDYLGELGPRPVIVGLSLGACRDFVLKTSSINDAPPISIRIPMPHNSVVIIGANAKRSGSMLFQPVAKRRSSATQQWGQCGQ